MDTQLTLWASGTLACVGLPSSSFSPRKQSSFFTKIFTILPGHCHESRSQCLGSTESCFALGFKQPAAFHVGGRGWVLQLTDFPAICGVRWRGGGGGGSLQFDRFHRFCSMSLQQGRLLFDEARIDTLSIVIIPIFILSIDTLIMLLTYREEFWPANRGFDSFFGFLIGAQTYFTHEFASYNLLPLHCQICLLKIVNLNASENIYAKMKSKCDREGVFISCKKKPYYIYQRDSMTRRDGGYDFRDQSEVKSHFKA